MGKGGNGLYFDGVYFFEGVVENIGGVDYLIVEVFVVKMIDE